VLAINSHAAHIRDSLVHCVGVYTVRDREHWSQRSHKRLSECKKELELNAKIKRRKGGREMEGRYRAQAPEDLSLNIFQG
jgi:hypothetical protein